MTPRPFVILDVRAAHELPTLPSRVPADAERVEVRLAPGVWDGARLQLGSPFPTPLRHLRVRGGPTLVRHGRVSLAAPEVCVEDIALLGAPDRGETLRIEVRDRVTLTRLTVSEQPPAPSASGSRPPSGLRVVAAGAADADLSSPTFAGNASGPVLRFEGHPTSHFRRLRVEDGRFADPFAAIGTGAVGVVHLVRCRRLGRGEIVEADLPATVVLGEGDTAPWPLADLARWRRELEAGRT